MSISGEHRTCVAVDFRVRISPELDIRSTGGAVRDASDAALREREAEAADGTRAAGAHGWMA
jgi:hypothetical protein